MALFYDGQPCPLCGVAMYDTDRLFATSHFLGPDSDLWAYSDAVIHWDCYATWEHRARFARMHFDAGRKWADQNSHWGIAYADDHVLVTTNPDKLVGEIEVMLAETGSSFRIDLADWTDWLRDEWAEGCHHTIEYDALAAVIPLLRTELPNAQRVIVAAGMETPNESIPVTASNLVARISYEMACEKLAARAARKGIVCPNCGSFSTDYEYMRSEQVSESGPQSHLVCRRCGKEFGPLDI